MYLASNQWYYRWVQRHEFTMANSHCTKQMNTTEWMEIKHTQFLPNEMQFIALHCKSIQNDDGTLNRNFVWNDDEIPIHLRKDRKQIVPKDRKKRQTIFVKDLFTTRDLTKRFATAMPLLHGNAFIDIPERYWKCLLILPGAPSKKEMAWHKKNCPNLVVLANETAWQTQEVFDIWTKHKMSIIQRVRNYLKQPLDTPHVNYIDHQVNHVSANSKQNVLNLLQNAHIWTRFYPKKSTHHVQAVDKHIGVCMQDKIKLAAYVKCQQQQDKIMKGQKVKKMNLSETRKFVAAAVQKSFIDICRNHKSAIISAFNHSGLHHITPRIWGGHDGMKVSERVRRACSIESATENFGVFEAGSNDKEENEDDDLMMDDERNDRPNVREDAEEAIEYDAEANRLRNHNISNNDEEYEIREPPKKKRKVCQRKVTDFFGKK